MPAVLTCSALRCRPGCSFCADGSAACAASAGALVLPQPDKKLTANKRAVMLKNEYFMDEFFEK
jgi:hypothetical protein